MKGVFLLGLIISIFSACAEKEKSDNYFVIPQIPEIGLKRPPIISYYGQHNFILFNDTTIYYFKNDVGFVCGTGIETDLLPEKIYLTPDSLEEIDTVELKQILNKNHNTRTVTVSSPSDTIRNEAFWILRAFIKENYLNCFIRKCTEEEYFTSNAKFNGKKYIPEDIHWKIGFEKNE